MLAAKVVRAAAKVGGDAPGRLAALQTAGLYALERDREPLAHDGLRLPPSRLMQTAVHVSQPRCTPSRPPTSASAFTGAYPTRLPALLPHPPPVAARSSQTAHFELLGHSPARSSACKCLAAPPAALV